MMLSPDSMDSGRNVQKHLHCCEHQRRKFLLLHKNSGISPKFCAKFMVFTLHPAVACVNPKKLGIPFLPKQCTQKWQKVHFFLDQTNSEHLILQSNVVVFDMTSATTTDSSGFHCTVTMAPHASLAKGILANTLFLGGTKMM
jgi:hypothetical protein